MKGCRREEAAQLRRGVCMRQGTGRSRQRRGGRKDEKVKVGPRTSLSERKEEVKPDEVEEATGRKGEGGAWAMRGPEKR